MRALWVMGLLVLVTATAGGETFKLPGKGRLSLYPVGDWKISAEDVGELNIVFLPARPGVFASAKVVVATGGENPYPNETLLIRQVENVARRLLETGDYVERKPTLKRVYQARGFGFYFTLTDPKRVGRNPEPGKYKLTSLGLIRLSPEVLVRFQLNSDGEETEAFQQLLGMLEGMELVDG